MCIASLRCGYVGVGDNKPQCHDTVMATITTIIENISYCRVPFSRTSIFADFVNFVLHENCFTEI